MKNDLMLALGFEISLAANCELGISIRVTEQNYVQMHPVSITFQISLEHIQGKVQRVWLWLLG